MSDQDSGGRQVDPLGVDHLVREPVRMALLSVLEGVAEADFVFLQRALGLTQGNLSTHLTHLEAGGLVEVIKSFQGRVPRTTVSITGAGRAARAEHWDQLQALHALATPVPTAAPAERARRRRPEVGPALA